MAAKVPTNGLNHGIPFFSDTSNKSMYTHDVSGTDSTAAGNTAFGFTAMDAITTGDDNVAIGENAATALTTGSNNVAIGKNAFAAATTAGRNICIGDGAGQAMGVDGGTAAHVFIGHNAGNDCTSNAYSIFIGGFAGDGHDTESHNIGIGYDALGGAVAGGEYNVAIGNYALDALTSADGNNAVGYQALTACTTGGYNQAVGDRALTAVVDGQKNTAIGQQAGFAITSGSNNIMIGYDSGRSSSPAGEVTTASNQLCLGDDNISAFFCADTSISSSDKRDKTDIENFTAGLSFIEKMQPVTYKWDKRSWYSDDLSVTPDGSKKATETNVGFLAQDVETLEKEIGFANDKNDMLFVNLAEDNERYGMKYERLVTVLVNAVKELSAKVKALEEA